jgi:hypothetical protein
LPAWIAIQKQDTLNVIRRYLKNRILAQGQGETMFQPTVILKYFEELKPGSNAEIGPIDIFETASRKRMKQ